MATLWTGIVLAGMSAFTSPSAQPAVIGQPLGQFLLWSDGSSFTNFGANESITIDLGAIGFACDFIFPAADVYIVHTGVTPGQVLVDAGGAPNTIIGAGGGVFVAETIGFTAPTGAIGAGTWAVIYDECQDGVFTPGQDACFDPAFTVTLPTVLPPVDPAIAAIKAQAAAQAAHWAGALQAYAGLFALYDTLSAVQAALDPGDFLLWLTQIAVGEYTGVTIQIVVLDSLLDMTHHWAGIAADPPDPNFDQLTPLELAPLVESASNDGLQRAVDDVANAAIEQKALTLALLRSIERYQGAAQASNAQWGLVHARASRDYARLLSAQLQRSSAAQANLGQALLNDGVDLDAGGPQVESLRDRIEIGGFSPLEILILEQLGHDGPAIANLADAFVNSTWLLPSPNLQAAVGAIQYDGGHEAGFPSVLAAGASIDAATIAALDSDAVLLDGLVMQIESMSAPEPAPTADAGGPYMATEGVALVLDASGSFDPDGVVTEYAWDLDRDGLFDDLLTANATVSHVFLANRGGLIGLRVTDDQGLQGIAYANVVVTNVNSPPAIVSHEPPSLYPDVALGQSLQFSVTATDPDMDAVSYAWFLDDVLVSNEADYLYSPISSGELGVRDVRVLVSDGLAYGGEVELRFGVGVTQSGLGAGSVTAYCFGDGSGAACPCGNKVTTQSGCQNSTGAGGLLSSNGIASVLSDQLTLTVSGVVPNTFGLIYMGGTQTLIPFGNGLRCVEPGPPGFDYLRFPLQFTRASGTFTLGPGIAAASSGQFGGQATIVAGSTWNFQCYYRDAHGLCGSTINLTNALSVIFGL